MVGWHHQLDGHEFEQALVIVMDQEIWHTAVHGVAKSQMRLSERTDGLMCPQEFFSTARDT